MSKRKDKKIRKIRNNCLPLKILRVVLFGTAIMSIVVFFASMSIAAVVNSYIMESAETLETITNEVNSKWYNKEVLRNQLNEIKARNDSVNEISFVDDSFVPIQKVIFPSNFGGFEFSESALKHFAEKNICRALITDNFNLEESGISNIWKSFNVLRFSSSKEKLEWANLTSLRISQWIVYRTNHSNVNVCVKYIYKIKNYHANLVIFFGFFAALTVILFLIIESSLIVSIIHNARHLNKAIYTDSVTGGFNKEYFSTRALKLFQKNQSNAVVQFRLEKYRNYCTAYGLAQGENLLEEIYTSLKKNISKKELVAHYEKSDFVLFLKYQSNDELNERLVTLQKSVNADCQKSRMVYSIGITKVESKKDDILRLVNEAALAMNKAKDPDRIAWFSEDMKEEQVWERRVEDDMEKGIANHEFQVYLQPKYSTKEEKLSAAEALVRWVHPELGFIPPGKFIPIFEKNGFITKLDDYMLRETAKLQAQWMNEGKKLVPISVNVSRAHFTQDGLAEHICSIVDEYRVGHQNIELELTESAFFDDKAVLLNTVKKLKEYGFKISMDDFGAGYSSLNSLKELPLDIIKLDAEFFRGIDDANRANTIVSDTISLAKKLGMSIVAEGIETREQVDFLASQECDLIQGYYFAKPLSVKDFVERAYGW